MALTLNPIDNEARLQIATDELAKQDLSRAGQIAAMLEQGIALSPRDARLYSALGVINERQDNLAAAYDLYGLSLELLPTELQALAGTLRRSVAEENFVEAADVLEIIAKRWGTRWSLFEPLIGQIAADGQGFERLSQRFAGQSETRIRLVNSLMRDPQLLPYAQRLLAEWHESGIDELQPLVNQVTFRLLGNGEHGAAFFLYRFTLDEAHAAEAGFVNNGRFAVEPSGSPFDWQLQRQAGLDLEMVPHREKKMGGLAVRFLNNPIRLLNNVSQTTRLLPRAYNLTVTYSQSNLRMPEPLRFLLRCQDEDVTLAEIVLNPGNEIRASTQSFVVPAQGCATQRLSLVNRQMTESWQNRYSGVLFVHEVSISQVGG